MTNLSKENKRLTEIYLANANDINAVIENVSDGTCIVIYSDEVQVFRNIEEADLNLTRAETEKLKEDGKLEFDGMFIQIT